EVLEKIVSDLQDEFAQQLQSAFKTLIAHEHAGEDLIAQRPAEIQAAMDARDLAALRDLFGISGDGKTWRRAEQAIEQCLSDELLPVYDLVRNDAWRDLGEHPDNFADDETDVRAALAELTERITGDTLEGFETAIALILAALPRFKLTARQLFDALGMT